MLKEGVNRPICFFYAVIAYIRNMRHIYASGHGWCKRGCSYFSECQKPETTCPCRKWCSSGIGYLAFKEHPDDLSVSEDACKWAVTLDLQEACLRGAFTTYFNIFGGAVIPRGRCDTELKQKSSRTLCLRYSGTD
eukprot:gnl/MRDRNA2_/MRDRNA2_24550_c0_seq1.p1 gnl/MRDRNA2_/MRDRNA2_24550_c0~~gnl/MRDRNA2_/MRDRNA2_24550_c0_seq1.p1  ORF type:complete len:135 (-),score=13.10 gnl/MRDRNA2_/MRDRNA2_24550_c0_seq1:288-692(-)